MTGVCIAHSPNRVRPAQSLLLQTRTKIRSLQSIMDSIQLELGGETVQHIFQQVGVRTPPMADSGITTIQSVTSESEAHVSSSSSDDDSCSLGCIIKEQLGSAI